MTNTRQAIDTAGREISILIDDVSSTAFLYLGRDTDAWLYVDIDGVVYPDSESNPNTVPVSVWNGETLRLPLPPNISANALHIWLQKVETQDLLETVHNGHSMQFDRQSQRGKGCLTDEAEDALNTLEREANELDTLEVWDAEEWLCESPLQSMWSAEDTLQQALKKLASEILERAVHIDGDLTDALLTRAISEANEGRALSSQQLEAIMLAERGGELLGG